ncbi:MAG: SRPBCC domain-containing protein [Patescibacteria group bacterium]
MIKLHYEITINAPKQKVWETMLNDATYRQWTEAFCKGSYYKGSWEKGADIQFLGPNEDGTEGGMISRIKDNRLYEFISIEHLGEIHTGKPNPSVTDWKDAYENYTFKEVDSKTEIQVDIQANMNQEFAKMFDDMWPNALNKLKEITEK